MTSYAYIRVSTEGKGQTTDNQRKVITDAGFSVAEFFSEDGVSGSVKAMKRPAFGRMVAQCKEGDTIIITMVDRLGRSASDILNVVEELKVRGIKLRVLQFDGVDVTSSMGKMVLSVMAACAELERNILIERTIDGLERTKAQGTKLGRPLTIKPSILRSMVSDRENSGLSFDRLEKKWGVPRNTIHRTVTEWGDKLDAYEEEWNIRQAQYAENS